MQSSYLCTDSTALSGRLASARRNSPPGSGSGRAIQSGFSVAFMSADELIEQLRWGRRDDEPPDPTAQVPKRQPADHRRTGFPGSRPSRYAPELQGRQLSLRARQRRRHGQQIDPRVAGHAFRARRAWDDDTRSAPPSLPRGADRRQELWASRDRVTDRRRVGRRRAVISGSGVLPLRLRCRPHQEFIGP